MSDRRRMQAGSGIYECESCGKKTRETGDGESQGGMCVTCWEESGLENEHSDSGHAEPVEGCPTCAGLYASASEADHGRLMDESFDWGDR